MSDSMTYDEGVRLAHWRAEALAHEAQIAALKARLGGMDSMNRQRQSNGMADAYGEEHFFAAERELMLVAESADNLRRRIGLGSLI